MDRLSNNNLDVVKDEGVQYLDPFIQILTDIPGGGTLKSSEPAADQQVLNRGVMLAESGNTDGIYNIVKTQKSDSTQAAATSITLLRTAVNIGLFKVGEFIAKFGAATASTITSVTRTSETQDTVVTGTAIGALATASIIVEASAASTVVAATLAGRYTALGFSRSVLKVRECDLTTLNNVNVGIVTRGVVNESLLPYPIDSTSKTNLTDRFEYR